MYAKSDITISLKENNNDAIVCFSHNGKNTTKTISMDDFIATLASNYNFSTGILPRGAKFYSGGAGNYKVGIEVPRGIRNIRYVRNGVFEYSIPFPHCFLIFHVIEKNVTNSKVFTLRNSIMGEKDMLYNFPFGNTYSSGDVCWGGVSKVSINKPMELLSLVSSFMESEYNGDLIGSFSFDHKDDVYDIKSLFDHLNGKETFPNDLLVSSGFKISQFMTTEKDK